MRCRFQSTPSRRGRRECQYCKAKGRVDFNPLPQEEGDSSWHFLGACSCYFNPLPQEEGDRAVLRRDIFFCISIHSLKKRETAYFKWDRIFFYISIHSLKKRETLINHYIRYVVPISIHSLKKRETKLAFLSLRTGGDFNPLPQEEGDAYWIFPRYSCPISIHSLKKRETDFNGRCNFHNAYFNPLPQEEGDPPTPQ